MKIDTPQFGTLDVDNKKLVEFPLGLPGFEHCKRFTLLEVEQTNQVFALLQSIDDPEISFSVTTPDLLGLHYEFELTEDEQALLQASSAADIAVLLMLRKEDFSELRRAGDSPVQANLTAPLVINVASMRGLQKVIARLGCEVMLKSI